MPGMNIKAAGLIQFQTVKLASSLWRAIAPSPACPVWPTVVPGRVPVKSMRRTGKNVQLGRYTRMGEPQCKVHVFIQKPIQCPHHDLRGRQPGQILSPCRRRIDRHITARQFAQISRPALPVGCSGPDGPPSIGLRPSPSGRRSSDKSATGKRSEAVRGHGPAVRALQPDRHRLRRRLYRFVRDRMPSIAAWLCTQLRAAKQSSSGTGVRGFGRQAVFHGNTHALQLRAPFVKTQIVLCVSAHDIAAAVHEEQAGAKVLSHSSAGAPGWQCPDCIRYRALCSPCARHRPTA